jgi:SAM-dependent methyltransferase
MAAAIAANRGAEVSGIDAAEELLAIARTRSPNAEFQQGDIEELPFEDNSFDVVAGFNSFQYAGNPGIALAEARRVAKPGGTVVILTWGEPEGMEAAGLIGAIKLLLPPPPPGAPGPFALSDEATLRGFAQDAGLKPLEVFDVDCPWQYPDEATALRGSMSAGVVALAINTSGEDAVLDAFANALTAFKQEDGSYLIGATFRCLLAEA